MVTKIELSFQMQIFNNRQTKVNLSYLKILPISFSEISSSIILDTFKTSINEVIDWFIT